MKSTVILITIATFAAAVPNFAAVAEPDLVDVLTNDTRFSTLATAATIAGLIPTLQSSGPFTVFAPTNDAFSALSAGVLDGLQANPSALENVILGHVVEGRIISCSLVSTNTTFFNGNTAVIVVSDAGITINGVKVTQADILASNGVVHVIDAVIMMDLIGVLTSDKKFSTLATAATAAGLIPTLQEPGPFTVFAPTNDAFNALPVGVLDGLLADPTALANVILGHVLQGNLFSSSLVSTTATFVNGNTATIVVSAAGITINGAKVIQADNLASNGVVHAIDAVIMAKTSSAKFNYLNKFILIIPILINYLKI